MFRSFKREDLPLHMTSAGLGAAGAMVGVFVNAIAHSVAGLGAVLHALTMRRIISRRWRSVDLPTPATRKS